MKPLSILKLIALVLPATLLMAGCGGSSSAAEHSANLPARPANGGSIGDNAYLDPVLPKLPNTLTITGRAIDGYLQGARVCVDLNDDGQCEPGDPTTTTTANGSYSLTVDPRLSQGKKMLAEIGPDTLDISSGSHFTTTFTLATVIEDPTTPIHITPITTLVAAKRIEGWSKLAAELAVQSVARASGADPRNLYDDYLANGDSATSDLASAIIAKLTDATLAGADGLNLACQHAIASAIVDSGRVSAVSVSGVARRLAPLSARVKQRGIDSRLHPFAGLATRKAAASDRGLLLSVSDAAGPRDHGATLPLH